MKTLKTQNLIKNLLFVGFALSVSLMIFNVYLSAQVSQDGLQIDTLTKRSETLKLQIAQLEQTSVAKTSLMDLSQKAEANGYQKIDKVVSIVQTNPVAANY